MQYLRRVLEVFPHAERAWLELAKLSRDGEQTSAATAGQLAERAMLSFQNYPDFSWKVISDLLTPQQDKAYRSRIYENIVSRYETLGRPDLACEARIRLTDYQVEAKDFKRAANGLTQTIRKFPAEGRYVPQMMEKLQAVCQEFRGGTDLLAKFYLELLPKIPTRRGDKVSQYCLKMYEQAMLFYQSNNKPREAATIQQALDRLRTGLI